jgi:ketosteroid isomerase-like protein
MSQGNVEIVRRALDAYARRDLDTLQLLNSPDLEVDWSESRGWVAAVYRGWDEALRFYNGYFEVFETITVEADAYLEAGDSVVVPNVAYTQGRDGVEATARSTIVFTLADGQITRVRLYQEEADALRAFGLA